MVGGESTMPTKIGMLVGMKADERMCHGMISLVSGLSLDAKTSLRDLNF